MKILHILLSVIMVANHYMAFLSKMELAMKYVHSDRVSSLYITSNTGSSVILWHDGSNVNSVIGPVAADELIHMVESIEEGKDTP